MEANQLDAESGRLARFGEVVELVSLGGGRGGEYESDCEVAQASRQQPTLSQFGSCGVATRRRERSVLYGLAEAKLQEG